MSTENLTKFIEATKTDAALREKIRSLSSSTDPAFPDEISRLSEEVGLPFTAEEFESARSGSLDRELTDEELVDVAGGNAEKFFRDVNRFFESLAFGLGGSNCPNYRD